jgi:hypothetical protein
LSSGEHPGAGAGGWVDDRAAARPASRSQENRLGWLVGRAQNWPAHHFQQNQLGRGWISGRLHNCDTPTPLKTWGKLCTSVPRRPSLAQPFQLPGRMNQFAEYHALRDPSGTAPGGDDPGAGHRSRACPRARPRSGSRAGAGSTGGAGSGPDSRALAAPDSRTDAAIKGSLAKKARCLGCLWPICPAVCEIFDVNFLKLF